MKRILQILCLAVAAISLSNCTAYDGAYVTTTGPAYRNAPRHHHGPYYGSSRYQNDRQVSYRSSSRYSRGSYDHDRHDSHNVRHYPGRSVQSTTVRADIHTPRIFR